MEQLTGIQLVLVCDQHVLCVKKKKSDLVLELNIYFTCPGEKIVLLDIVSSDKETAYISL